MSVRRTDVFKLLRMFLHLHQHVDEVWPNDVVLLPVLYSVSHNFYKEWC